MSSENEALVLDASAMVDLLVPTPSAPLLRRRLLDGTLHVPAHFEAEVLSALGRIHRGGHLSADQVASRLSDLADVPIRRHDLRTLLAGAWDRRGDLRPADALYVELAEQLDTPLITTDDRLASASPRAENPAAG